MSLIIDMFIYIYIKTCQHQMCVDNSIQAAAVFSKHCTSGTVILTGKSAVMYT